MLFVLFKYIIIDFLNLVFSKLLVMLKFINVIYVLIYIFINIYLYIFIVGIRGVKMGNVMCVVFGLN